MKTKFIIISILAICLFIAVSCKKEQASPAGYVVEGIVDTTLNGQKVYLLDYNPLRNIDSVVVDSGKFVFKGILDSVRYCRITIGRNYANFVLETGKITIDMEKHNAFGTSLNEALVSFIQQKDSLRELSWNSYSKLEEQEKDPVIFGKKWDSIYANKWKPGNDKLMDKTLDANSNNIVGWFVIREMAMSSTTGRMDTAFAKLRKNILELKVVQELVIRNEILKKTAEGMKFTDFTITQEDSSKVSLSDYVGKGKYVLVDFWASWCGPCRAETPNLKELYSKYKGAKFEIVGVAVWDELAKSKKAIAEDKITWPQILNAGNIPTDLYGIIGIPHIILFGPDGTIIARDLREEIMKAKVAEALK